MKQTATPANYPGPPVGGDNIILTLLKEAIDSELTALQKNTVNAVWYQGRKVSEISRAENVSEQTVRKRLKISMGRLESALRYAVRYAQLRSLEEEN